MRAGSFPVGLMLTLPLAGGCLSDLEMRLGRGLGTESSILVSIGGQGVQAWAQQSAVFRQSLPQGDGLDLFVLEYDVGLGALGLQEGPLALVDDLDQGQPLPATDRVRLQRAEGGQLSEPEAIEIWPEALERVRLGLRSVPECVQEGGCMAPRPDGVIVCNVPCPEPTAPAPAVAPNPVNLGPCAEGWVEHAPDTAYDIMECEPWEVAHSCAEGSAQRPGQSECVSIGQACPSGPWPDSLPMGAATYYVDARAPSGGDGSLNAPLTSLSAVPLTQTGTTVVVLAAGSYSVPATLPDAVHLLGACAEQTRILNVVQVGAGQVVLQDMEIQGLSLRAGSARLEGVRVQSGRSVALEVSGGRLTAQDLLVSAAGQTGLAASGAAVVDVGWARFEGVGVEVGRGASVTVHDSVIRGAFDGLRVNSGASAHLERVVIQDNLSLGIRLIGAGAELEVHDVISEGRPETQARVYVAMGARLTGRALSIRHSAGSGLTAVGGVVDLEDLLIRDTEPELVTLNYGTALEVIDQGDVTLQRAHFVRSNGFGILMIDPESQLRLVDGVVAEVAGRRSNLEAGTGISVAEGHLDVHRVLVTRAHGMGIALENAAQVTGADLTVQDILPRDSNGAYGRGIEVDGAAFMQMDRLKVDRAKNIAIQILNTDSRGLFRDVIVTGTERSECYMFSCNAGVADGVTVTLNGALDMERFLVDGNGQYGVRVINQSSLVMRDGTISNNPVGVQVITQGYDLNLLTQGVRIENNGTNLDLLAEQ